MPAEEWRPISYLNSKYEASNLGRIRNAKTKKILKQFTSKHGYAILTARPEPYKTTNVRVHQAVADAFVGPRPKGFVVNHIDGNKKNNTPENLEYVSPSENNIHALSTGLRHRATNRGNSPKGEAHYRAKLSDADVIKILKIRKETGYGCRKISAITNLPCGAVNHVLSGRSWKHIKREEI